ncbi:MarR family transcriptional regulator [Erythrobacter ani]|nr:MarR family transcriptional regulator [Erythrobacter ani]
MADDFTYDVARDSAGLPARVAIFADRPRMRAEIAEDLTGAGFRTVDGGEIAALLDGPITLLGDVVMVDCPVLDGSVLASLARLDMRIARSGAELIVVTSLEALDDIFAVLDQSRPQILVEPSRAERVVAVGRTLANVSGSRAREMSEEDRMALLRLSQQVDGIAQELDRISLSDAPKPQRLSDYKREFRGAGEPLPGDKGLGARSAYPPLPDPRMVRQMLAARQARARFFDGELFADPAWDMLLDLTAAHAEHKRVSVTSLCIAAGVPATTALRWVKQMVESGIFERVADRSDKRRAFIALSERSVEAMARYFAEVEIPLAQAA